MDTHYDHCQVHLCPCFTPLSGRDEILAWNGRVFTFIEGVSDQLLTWAKLFEGFQSLNKLSLYNREASVKLLSALEGSSRSVNNHLVYTVILYAINQTKINA